MSFPDARTFAEVYTLNATLQLPSDQMTHDVVGIYESGPLAVGPALTSEGGSQAVHHRLQPAHACLALDAQPRDSFDRLGLEDDAEAVPGETGDAIGHGSLLPIEEFL